MKKLMIIALALIFMVPALAVFAGEVELGGSYRMTWTKYDPGWAGTDTDLSEGPDDIDYFQQRIRLPITWKANDNVLFFIRMDWAEEGFGNATGLTSVDYAYAKISHDLYTLTTGKVERYWANGMMYDPDLYGIALDLRPAPGMSLSFDYGKQDENGANTDSSLADTNDRDLFAVKFQFASDAFTIGAMIAQEDGPGSGAAGTNKEAFTRGYGVYANIPVGDAIKIAAELNIFDGDNGLDGAAKIDYVGTQFLFDFGLALSETVAIGFTTVYAEGTDDADEAQITEVDTGGASFASPMDFGGALRYDEAYGFGVMTSGFFEPAANSGILGAAFRVTAKVAEPVTLHARAGWVATDEDDVNGVAADLEDIMFFNVSVDYAWQPNVTLSAGVFYADADFNDDAAIYTEEKTAFVARLGINF